MKDPVADFKATVANVKPGEILVYHVGALGAEISSSPTLTHIQMMAYGLYLMGRVGLRQKRMEVATDLPGITVPRTEYSFKVLQPINVLDFDTARKTYLDSLGN